MVVVSFQIEGGGVGSLFSRRSVLILRHATAVSFPSRFVSDAHRIRAVSPAGDVTTIAGGAAPGRADGAGAAARAERWSKNDRYSSS